MSVIFSSIFLSVVAIIIMFMKGSRSYTRVLCCYFACLSLCIFVGSLYIGKVSFYSTNLDIDFKIFSFINNIPLGVSDISQIYNFFIALYMGCTVLSMRYFFKISYFKVLFMSLPCIYYYIFNSPQVSKLLFLTANTSSPDKAELIKNFVNLSHRFNEICFMGYLVIPLIGLALYGIKTSIFVKRRDAIVAGLSIFLINFCTYMMFIKGQYYSLLFDNVNVARVPESVEFSNNLPFETILPWIILLISMFLAIKFRAFTIFDTKKNEKVRQKHTYFDKNVGMILHSYKNAFLGILQQFEIAQANIDKGDYKGIELNIDTGINIVNDHMVMLNKMISSIKKLNIVYEQTNLMDCVNTALNKLPFDDRVKVDMTTSYDEIYVYADEHHLTEVFLNLFMNAVESVRLKDIDDGILKINIHVEKEAVLISIKDNGVGIERNNIKKVFQPFFSTKSGMNGGVGLSYVIRVIQQCHGDIKVKSRVNEYAEFQVVLPAVNV